MPAVTRALPPDPRPDPTPAADGAPSGGAERALMLLGLLTFLHIGGVQALYGPSFGALQARYAIGVAEVGTSVSAHFGGAFVSTLLAGAVLARFGYRPALLASSVLVGVGSVGIAFAPTWGGALAGSLLVGLGYGLAVVLYNFLFARVFAARGAAAVNLINGTFGVGAVLSPALVALATTLMDVGGDARGGAVTAVVFGGSALLAVAVAVQVVRTPWLPPVLGASTSSARAALEVGVVVLFCALFFVYVAVEVGTTAWAPTHLAEQVGAARAALAASVFWVAMTLGRFGAAALGGRAKPRDIVVACVLGGLVGVGIAHLPGLALVGYGVAGLALGPVFPTGVAWVQRRFGTRAERVGPFVIAAGNLGPVVGAPAIGIAAAAAGPEAIPSVLAIVLAVLLAIVALAWANTRRHEARLVA